MNCPVNYSENADLTKAADKQPLPVNIPMKPRFPRTAASLRECVEMPHVNHELITVLPDFGNKKVTWKDSLFPCHKSSPSIKPPRIRPTTELRDSTYKSSNYLEFQCQFGSSNRIILVVSTPAESMMLSAGGYDCT